MKGKEFDNSYRRKSYSVIQYLLIVICPALEPINIFKIYKYINIYIYIYIVLMHFNI